MIRGEFMYSFGKRIRQVRTQAQISQVNLAKKIGGAKSSLSLYESDKREPSIQTIQKIARALQTSTDYLLGLEEEPSFFRSEFEKQLVTAFRQTPDMQKAVCVLLGISPEDWFLSLP